MTTLQFKKFKIIKPMAQSGISLQDIKIIDNSNNLLNLLSTGSSILSASVIDGKAEINYYTNSPGFINTIRITLDSINSNSLAGSQIYCYDGADNLIRISDIITLFPSNKLRMIEYNINSNILSYYKNTDISNLQLLNNSLTYQIDQPTYRNCGYNPTYKINNYINNFVGYSLNANTNNPITKLGSWCKTWWDPNNSSFITVGSGGTPWPYPSLTDKEGFTEVYKNLVVKRKNGLYFDLKSNNYASTSKPDESLLLKRCPENTYLTGMTGVYNSTSSSIVNLDFSCGGFLPADYY